MYKTIRTAQIKCSSLTIVTNTVFEKHLDDEVAATYVTPFNS